MTPRLPATSLLLALLLSACGGLGGEPDIIATFPPPSHQQTSPPSDWQPNISAGGQIFAEHCADCHGISGRGQGELVLAGSIPAPIDMTNPALTADKSPLDWFNTITNGNIENLMPPWRSALNEQQRWDVALYAYTLAYDGEWLALGQRIWRDKCPNCPLPALIPPVFSDRDYSRALNRERFDSALEPIEALAAAAHARMTSLRSTAPSAAPTPPIGAFTGRIQHGAPGGTVPPDSRVQLRYGSPDHGYQYAETALDPNSHFTFDNIPLTSAYSYWVAIAYQDRVFSQLMKADHPPDSEYDATITIYDATHDPRVITLSAIDLYLNPVRLETLGKGFHATQILRYHNSSDHVFTSGRGFEDGREASLLVQFPAHAKILSNDAAGRYVLIEDLHPVPNSLIDTLAVPPGPHEIALEFFLPFSDDLRFEQTFNNLVDAKLTISIPQSIEIASPSPNLRVDSDNANHINIYSGQLTGESEAQLRFHLDGNPFATSSEDTQLITSEVLLPALLAFAALLMPLAVGLALWQRKQANTHNAIDSLSRQIAHLDDAHDRGQINHDLYHHRRRQLKDKLASLMNAQQDDQ